MSGGGSQQTTSQTKVEYSPQEQAARDKVMQNAMATFDNSPRPGYGVGAPSDPSWETRHSWNMGKDAAAKIGFNTDQAQHANNFGMRDVLYAESNPYLQSHMEAATRPMIEQFQSPTGPLATIRNNSVMNGTVGSSRQGIAEGLAAKALMGQIGDVRSRMASDAYSKGLDVQQSAIKNQAMLNMMTPMGAQLYGQQGAQMEGYQQARNNFDAGLSAHNSTSQWGPLQNLANVIYGGSNGTTTSTSNAPKQDNTMQTIGTVGSLAMMAMMM